MIAAAAARAHHLRDVERHSREEAQRRSQLVNDADSQAVEPAKAEVPYTPLAAHYLQVPFRDCDSDIQDGHVSRDEFHLSLHSPSLA